MTPNANAPLGSQAASGVSTTVRRDLDVERLQGFLSSIRSYAGPEMILAAERPLFHYTDLQGLLGIVGQGDLWLTHLRYSNDDEEMAHGQRVVADVLGAALKEADSPARRAYLERLRKVLDEMTPQGVYICCFCEEDNLLSQWRAYGANGTGVSVRVDPAGLGHLTGADCAHGLLRFWKVFYKEKTQQRIVRAALDYTFTQDPGAGPEKLAQRAADAIQFFIPTFKNADFDEEAEWRLIFTPRPNAAVRPRFRVSRNLLIPFYSLRELSGSPPSAPGTLPSQPPLPIQQLTVGPSVHRRLNAESAEMVLKQYGYSVTVQESKTPYRG